MKSGLRLLVALAGVASAGLAAGETFPSMKIARSGVEHEWAFSVDEGSLTCVDFGGELHVLFTEPKPADASVVLLGLPLPRSVAVSTNPLALMSSLEDRALYRPFDSLEQLILRLAPFEVMGKRLCLDRRK